MILQEQRQRDELACADLDESCWNAIWPIALMLSSPVSNFWTPSRLIYLPYFGILLIGIASIVVFLLLVNTEADWTGGSVCLLCLLHTDGIFVLYFSVPQFDYLDL